MLNRPLDQLYPPGSTFKVITTAAALRDGVDPNIRLTAARSITLPGSTATLTNYGNQTCPGAVGGTVTLACVPILVQYRVRRPVVNKLKQPETTLAETAKAVRSRRGDPSDPAPVRAQVDTGDVSDRAALGQSAIGQYNVRMSALQNAIIAATVANGGVRMQPYLVDKLTRSLTLSTTSPATVNEPITAAQAATLTSLMIDLSANRGGRRRSHRRPGLPSTPAGPGSGEVPYAWYIAFGPRPTLQIAVAVVVENGQLGTGTTGQRSLHPSDET